MIVMLALLNDGAILSIAYDNVHYKDKPEAWNMPMVLGGASPKKRCGAISGPGQRRSGHGTLARGAGTGQSRPSETSIRGIPAKSPQRWLWERGSRRAEQHEDRAGCIPD